MQRASLIWLLLCFFTISIAHSADLVVRVPMTPYPPFFTQSETGEWQGLSIELTEALLKESGFTPVYRPLPFKRALKHLENGSLDMMVNLTITKERKKFINFIGPQLDETVVMVVLKDSDFLIETLDDIKTLPRPISVEVGKLYGETFENKRITDAEFDGKITSIRQLSSNEKMLESGRTSGFLGYGYHIFDRFKTNEMYVNFKVHPFIFRQDWVHFGFSKKAIPTDVMNKIAVSFEHLEKDGTFEKIKKRYTIQ